MSLNRYLILTVVFAFILSAFAQNSSDPIQAFTGRMQKFPGYFTFYWDAQEGKIWLEIDRWEEQFLYVNSLRQGIGSNDIGLDRGQLGNSRIVYFRRSGPRVLLVQPNFRYRAMTDNPAERIAVEQSFAFSVLGGFTIKAESGERVLLDFTEFFLQDAHNLTGRLLKMNEGEYALDPARSAFAIEATKNFPLNSEFEVLLTFSAKNPGPNVGQVTPTPSVISVNQHHSFIKLPDGGYKMRPFNPRAGFFGIEYSDYATSFTESLKKRYIARHRLIKKNPDAVVSEPVEPIVYYVDRGAPEPIRTALVEGALWWNEAFEAAGFKNAFRVEIMPEDADPLDIRYNVIQWVHRSTRGWSYGDAVIDPRTGEIIKGHISLGSLRVRQDYLIAEGLLAPYTNNMASTTGLESFALARLRQLSAHEVGHTLGLMHNYAASTIDRASVMDYPHPLIYWDKYGKPDLSEAYTEGIGPWDKISIAYGYREFAPDQNLDSALISILEKGDQQGLTFLTDADARPEHSVHPAAHLWDNGRDPVTELRRLIELRMNILKQFSLQSVRPGEPLATLEERLVPMYLLHRYQVEAAAKLIGGLSYTYALRDSLLKETRFIDPEHQRLALASLLETIQPGFLKIPESILTLLPPRPPGYPRGRELFLNRTGLTFDPLNAAEASAAHTLRLILNPQRAARLVEYHARNKKNISLDEILTTVLSKTWYQKRQNETDGALQQTVNHQVLNHFFNLAVYPETSLIVRAMTFHHIQELYRYLEEELDEINEADWRASYRYAIHQIERFNSDPAGLQLSEPPVMPDGAPIGDNCLFFQE